MHVLVPVSVYVRYVRYVRGHVYAWVLAQMTEPGCWPDVAAMPVVGSLPLFDAHLGTPRIGSQGLVGRRRGLQGTHSSFAE